jgi:hypothetical protein
MSEDGKINYQLRALGFTVGEQDKPQRRPRRPSLKRALADAKKADQPVSGATLAADGSVSLSFGSAGAGDIGNEWDTVLRHGKN